MKQSIKGVKSNNSTKPPGVKSIQSMKSVSARMNQLGESQTTANKMSDVYDFDTPTPKSMDKVSSKESLSPLKTSKADLKRTKSRVTQNRSVSKSKVRKATEMEF